MTEHINASCVDDDLDIVIAAGRHGCRNDDIMTRTKTLSNDEYTWCDVAALTFIDGDDGVLLAKGMNYTKPALRERIKRRVMAGSRGGKPGQWSARKAQIVAQEYRKAGGGYKGRKGKAQRSLSKWTKEKWRTSDGKPAIRKGGTTRYLPAKAWSKLSPSERAATNRKKREASKRGRQFVSNTAKAKKAGRAVRKASSKDADAVSGGDHGQVTRGYTGHPKYERY